MSKCQIIYHNEEVNKTMAARNNGLIPEYTLLKAPRFASGFVFFECCSIEGKQYEYIVQGSSISQILITHG